MMAEGPAASGPSVWDLSFAIAPHGERPMIWKWLAGIMRGDQLRSRIAQRQYVGTSGGVLAMCL